MLSVGDRVIGRSFSDARAAVPSSVPAMRRSIVAFARDSGADDAQCEAIRLAASEALTNVVVHAYDHPGGCVRVHAEVNAGEISVTVGDDGRGLQAPSPYHGLGQGLSLIATMADSIAAVGQRGGGIELRMRFALRTRHRATSGDSPAVLSRAALAELAA